MGFLRWAPENFRWSGVDVLIDFKSKTTTTSLLEHVDQQLRRLGRNSDYQNDVNGGKQVGWSRYLENGSLAKAQLTNLPLGGTAQDWEMYVTAPPVGPEASGC